MSERKTIQTFTYTGSTEYEFNNVMLDTVNSLSTAGVLSDYGGIGPAPYEGATVTMRTGDIGIKGGVKDLQPLMNNNLYYLITDKVYSKDDIQTVKSLATLVPAAVVSGKYEGTFTFTNPNDYKNLYLIWDYSDNMVGGTASYNGGEVTKYIDLDLGDGRGVAGIDYNVTNTPARVLIKLGETVYADSGYVGLNSIANYNDLIAAGVDDENINLTFPYDGLVNNGIGSVLFQKKSGVTGYKVVVESPLVNTAWSLATVPPTKTSFFIDITARDTSEETEADCPTITLYHDGFDALPQPGDSIYQTNDALIPVVGINKYNLVDITLCTGPSTTTSRWIKTNEFGSVVNTGDPHFVCTEVAVPVITQIDIEMLNSTYIDLCIEATNNPTLWDVTSSYNNYEIIASDCGAIFEYTNYLGETVTDVIGKNITTTVASTTLPVVTSGAATITLNSVNYKGSLPDGVVLNTTSGTLSGTPRETGVYPLTLTATNCFGTSASVAINISVISAVKLTAIGIASEEVAATSALAIALTPAGYNIMYHGGITTLPVVGDIIYIDAEGTTRLIGNSQWYRLNGSASAFQIDRTGRVIDIV
jgi:hypothetical protein